MKNLIMFLAATLFVFAANAKKTVAMDTINGNVTVMSESMLWPKSIQASIEEISGTADGTLRLQASLDNSKWAYITETSGFANFFPNDTLTIVDKGVWLINIREKSFPYWRVVGTGTSGDVEVVEIKYFK